MLNKRIIILLSIFIVLAAGFCLWQKFGKNIKAQEFFKIRIETKKAVCPFDGLYVSEKVANRTPLAIMIENQTDSRPQSGLYDASLIYEAIAEGGITRFMAVYVWGEPEKVGPVRSARTYFIDFANELGAFYAHVGGNLDALEKIKTDKILDLDQFKYGKKAYWREPEKGKATEHTMYTKPAKLWEIAKENKWEMEGNYQSFDFKEDLDISGRPESASVTIDFSQPSYKVRWIYNREKNSYKRELGGLPHQDKLNKKQLEAKNLILADYERWQSPTEIGEQGFALKTIGSGKSKICLDGKVIEGTWQKDSRTSRTWFYDSNGSKIKFNRGQFWIEIIHPEISVKIE